MKQSVELRAYNGDTSRSATDRLNALIDAGAFTVHIDKTFPLEQAAAHEVLGAHFAGKTVLTMAQRINANCADAI